MDVLTNEGVFGPHLGTLKEKTVLYNPPQVASKLCGDMVPWDVKKRYHEVVLTTDMDYIQKKALCMVHCPTDVMLGDYITKPLQGALFH